MDEPAENAPAFLEWEPRIQGVKKKTPKIMPRKKQIEMGFVFLDTDILAGTQKISLTRKKPGNVFS